MFCVIATRRCAPVSIICLQTAHDNDQLFEKTKRLVLTLLEAKNLSSMVEAVYDSLGKDFNIEFYSLTLLGDEKKLPTPWLEPQPWKKPMSELEPC